MRSLLPIEGELRQPVTGDHNKYLVICDEDTPKIRSFFTALFEFDASVRHEQASTFLMRGRMPFYSEENQDVLEYKPGLCAFITIERAFRLERGSTIPTLVASPQSIDCSEFGTIIVVKALPGEMDHVEHEDLQSIFKDKLGIADVSDKTFWLYANADDRRVKIFGTTGQYARHKMLQYLTCVPQLAPAVKSEQSSSHSSQRLQARPVTSDHQHRGSAKQKPVCAIL